MFCLVGVNRVWLYRPFVKHKAFHLAIDRFKRILNYLRQFYFIPEIYNKYEKSMGSQESLLSNFDNFNEYMYQRATINRDATDLIKCFLDQRRIINTIGHPSTSKDVESLFLFINSILELAIAFHALVLISGFWIPLPINNISIKETENSTELTYSDNGKGLNENLSGLNKGFGLELIKLLIYDNCTILY